MASSDNRAAEHPNENKKTEAALGNEITIQATNDSSIGSKRSMAWIGYFEDKFLQYVVPKKTRRAPLINRGYYVRAKTIDYAVKSFLSHFKDENAQIISLGAGFDTSFFRLQDEGLLSNVRFLEIDFPDVVKRKISMIQKNETLARIVGPFEKHENGIVSDSYALIASNITDIKNMENILESIGFMQNVPTLFVSEVVLTYIDRESCSRLISWSRNRFPNSVFLLYEQIYPHDAFGFVMQNHFRRLQSPLRCIEYYPDIASQMTRFLSLGWSSVNAMDMNDFYNHVISSDERDRIDQLEPFDEFEEWHLKCCHYSVVAAFSGSCSSLNSKLFAGKRKGPEADACPTSVLSWKSENENIVEFERYGHSLLEISKDLIMISGGFGRSGSRHKRLDDAVIVKLGSQNNVKKNKTSMFSGPRMYHSTTLLDKNLIFLFGGRSSPSKPCKDVSVLKFNIEITRTDKGEKNELCDSEFVVNFETKWNKELLSMNSNEPNQSQPCCRWRHTATKIYSENNKEHILVFGGRNEKHFALSDFWTFDVENRCWKEESIAALEVKKRHSHSASNWKNRVIFTGGLDRESQPLNLFQILSYQTNPMTLESIEFEVPFPARYSHSSHVVRDELWIVGGVGLKLLHDVIVVDLNNFSWSQFDLQSTAPYKPMMLCNHSSVLVDEKELLIIGGGGNLFSFGTHFNKGLSFVDLSRKGVEKDD